MSDTKELRKFKKGIRLGALASPPDNAEKGAMYIDNSGKLFIHNGTDFEEVVDKTTAQTLTNKSIDADNNTISNIEVDNLKSGVLDTDISTTSASDDTIPSAKAAKSYVDSSIVTERDTASTLSNKTFSDPITLDHEATPTAPASGKVKIYAKNDNKLHILDSNGAESSIGSGSGGSLDTFHTEDFTTLQNSDINETSGKYSLEILNAGISKKTLKVTISNTCTTGDKIVFPVIDLNARQKGQTCSISFYYYTTKEGNQTLYNEKIDVIVATDSGFTNPILVSSLKDNGSIKKFVDTFTVPSNVNNLYYGFKCNATNPNGVFFIDDIEFSQDPFVQADLGTITEWVSYTPTTPGIVENGGDFSRTGKWRRVGDSMEIQAKLERTSANGTPTGHISFGLPSGYTMDRSKIVDYMMQIGTPPYNIYMAPVGTGVVGSNVGSSGDVPYPVMCYASGEDLGNYTNTIQVMPLRSSEDFASHAVGSNKYITTIDAGTGTPFPWDGNGDHCTIKVSVPITGWGSTNTHIVTPAKSNLTNWTSFTPETTWDGDATGAPNNKEAYWRRVGDEMELRFSCDFTGTPTSGAHFQFKMPKKSDGKYYKVDTVKLPENFDGTIPYSIGHMAIRDNGGEPHTWAGTTGIEIVTSSGTTTVSDTIRVRMYKVNSDGINIMYLYKTGNPGGIGDIQSGYQLTATAKVPIEGWSAQDSNFLAALPMTKWQQKKLDSNFTGNDIDITALSFTNLDSTKTYKLTVTLKVVVTSAGAGIYVRDAASGGGNVLHTFRPYRVANTQHEVVGGTVVATGVTSLYLHAFEFNATDLIHGGTANDDKQSKVLLEELPMHEKVEIW